MSDIQRDPRDEAPSTEDAHPAPSRGGRFPFAPVNGSGEAFTHDGDDAGDADFVGASLAPADDDTPSAEVSGPSSVASHSSDDEAIFTVPSPEAIGGGRPSTTASQRSWAEAPAASGSAVAPMSEGPAETPADRIADDQGDAVDDGVGDAGAREGSAEENGAGDGSVSDSTAGDAPAELPEASAEPAAWATPADTTAPADTAAAAPAPEPADTVAPDADPATTTAIPADSAAEATTPTVTRPEAPTASQPDTTPAHADTAAAGTSAINPDQPTVTAPPTQTAEDAPTTAPTPMSSDIPPDVLGARMDDNPSTTMMRRSLIAPATPSAGVQETTWRPREDTPEEAVPTDTPDSLDDAIFEGATVVAEVPGRGGAHVWSLIVTLLGVPALWYLVADAATRMTMGESSVLATGRASYAALGEMAGATVIVALLVWLATKSSLGAWVWGVVLTLAGLLWLAMPTIMADATRPALETVGTWGAFGQNLVHHWQAGMYTGLVFIFGVLLLGVGVVSHATRRRGRTEEAIRAQVERVNPAGAHFSWRARRKAAKAAKAARH